MRESKKRTLWPLGILLIILLGVVLIVLSIKIATSQSIDVDKSFGAERNTIDLNINNIMSYQNEFEKFYVPYLGINKIPAFSLENIIKNPYYMSSVPKDYPQQTDRLHKSNNVLYFALQDKQNNETISPVIKDVMLEITRLAQGDKNITTINIPMTYVPNATIQNLYKSATFSLPLDGYYQVQFAICIIPNKHHLKQEENVNVDIQAQQIIDSTVKKSDKHYCNVVYFSHWVFNGNPTQEKQKDIL